MAHILYVSKIVFLFCLIGICFFVFGLDFITKYLASEITVTESIEQEQALRPPAITICPQVGWKNSKADNASFRVHCEHANNADMFWECLEDKTYDFDEIILSASHGQPMHLVKNLSWDEQIWTWSTPARTVGRCYTLHYDQLFKIDMATDAIVVNLNQSSKLYYHVFLHDPDFFTLTYNPFATPLSFFAINPKALRNSHLLLPIAITRMKKLNQERTPCNPAKNYSFTSCVKESLVKALDCSLPWEPLGKGNTSSQSSIDLIATTSHHVTTR